MLGDDDNSDDSWHETTGRHGTTEEFCESFQLTNLFQKNSVQTSWNMSGKKCVDNERLDLQLYW